MKKLLPPKAILSQVLGLCKKICTLTLSIALAVSMASGAMEPLEADGAPNGVDVLDVPAELRIERMKEEHLAAGQVYEYLHGQGFTDPVIAGILGNMMCECGGQTLDLQWGLYGGRGGYYGLCMWSLYYGPGVKGLSLAGQMDYLMETLETNMTIFGGSYDYFCSLQDPGAAARYFAKYYERGAGAAQRARNAARALEWIGGGEAS